MIENWQNAIVLAVVALAAVYLVVRALRIFSRKKAAGCGSGCSSCPAGSESKPQRLVSIELEPKATGLKGFNRPI